MQSDYVEVLVLTEDDSDLPTYSTWDASGADVRAKLKAPLVIKSGESCLVPTGLKFEIPSGYELQVRPRSGLALKNQVTVLNSPGTIDADYRGELGIILINHGKNAFIVEPGMRIAQIVIAPVLRARFIIADELTETRRGSGGFGHTGLN